MKDYPDVVGLESIKVIYELIDDEHMAQFKKWGLQRRTLFEWVTYLTEEVGELAKAISENEYREGTKEEITKEAVQVAALACKIAMII